MIGKWWIHHCWKYLRGVWIRCLGLVVVLVVLLVNLIVGLDLKGISNLSDCMKQVNTQLAKLQMILNCRCVMAKDRTSVQRNPEKFENLANRNFIKINKMKIKVCGGLEKHYAFINTGIPLTKKQPALMETWSYKGCKTECEQAVPSYCE